MDSNKYRSNNKKKSTPNSNQYMMMSEQAEESTITDAADHQESIIADSPPPSAAIFNIDGLVSSPTSSTKRRRATQKRVVQIPIKETEGPRLKGESNTPPSDSWAWRKYGQKPIKGSPYPRGYYRCSSYKGCPARKQVERSRLDPTMLLVTYSSDHNHPWPVSRNHHSAAASRTPKKPQPQENKLADPLEPEPEPEDKFADLGGQDSIIAAEDDLGWFGDMAAASTTSSSLRSSIFSGYDADVAASVLLPMGEEEESLFADLGELPECSVVFRRGLMETAEQQHRRRYAAAPWCGTTS